jgi:hypothetical protein
MGTFFFDHHDSRGRRKIMLLETVTFARRHVLGEMHTRCDRVDLLPVFMEGDMETQIGYVDENMGQFADAYSFHLPANVLKKLSSGQLTFSFGFAHDKTDDTLKKPRVKLTHICLTKIKPIA